MNLLSKERKKLNIMLVVFAFLHLCYLLAGRVHESFYLIHHPLDDAIPFVPEFVIIYISWYIHLLVPIVYFFFRDYKVLQKILLVLIPGMAISIAGFWLLPTGIDFRPTAEGEGISRMLCRLLFFIDRPVNVCPSLHCYEAVGMNLALSRHTALRKHPILLAASWVWVILICLSTVFIKQHSIIDLVCGVVLAFACYGLARFPERKTK